VICLRNASELMKFTTLELAAQQPDPDLEINESG
jgi:hypothetical protein